jgi:hypothetical protein
MDTKTLAHVSGELIAFVGLTVYFQRKSSALEERVRKLEADNNEIIDNLEHLNETMGGLYNYIRGRTPGTTTAPVSVPVQTQPVATQSAPVTTPLQESFVATSVTSTPTILPVVSAPAAAASTSAIATAAETSEISDDSESVLQEEMHRMQLERESLENSGANTICENGVCTIPSE